MSRPPFPGRPDGARDPLDRHLSGREPQSPGPLSQASLMERLARWDELPPEELARLEQDPKASRALARLRELEAELDAVSPPELPCPDAEELYAFAGGPGAAPLPPLRRAPVQRHLETCRPCAGLVATLQTAPPPPLIAASLQPAREDRAELRSLLRWAPAAAAAAVLLAATQPLGGDAELGAWPEQPTMRGARPSPLAFPRGRVLSGALGAWASHPRFEIGEATAEGFVLRVRRHGGGAFEEGQVVVEQTSSQPEVVLDRPLAPGSYSWEVEALQGGSRTWLGSREFQVVEDEEVVRGLMQRRGVAAIEYLHERGFLTDARTAARSQPASPERDAYLSARPAR